MGSWVNLKLSTIITSECEELGMELTRERKEIRLLFLSAAGFVSYEMFCSAG